MKGKTGRDNAAVGGASWPRVCQLCNGAGRGESETGNQSALCGSESFTDNACITKNGSPYRMPCSLDAATGKLLRFDTNRSVGSTFTARNRFYAPNASIEIGCGGLSLMSELTHTQSAFACGSRT